MITIAVIAAVICTTELLFEILDHQTNKKMTGTTAKAHLYDLLMEPLRGCKGLNLYRHSLMKRVMSMPDLEVRERLEQLQRFRHQAD